MNEHTYLSTQEHITEQAFDALARCRAAATPSEKLDHWQVYQSLCEGACRLRMAYQETLRRIQAQRSVSA